MANKRQDGPGWRLVRDLDNPDPIGVLRGAEPGRHHFVWLGDRLFMFKRTDSGDGTRVLLEIVEGACIRHGEHQAEGEICFTDPPKRAGYSEEFVWRNQHQYEAEEVGLRPDVARLFFEGFFERARERFV